MPSLADAYARLSYAKEHLHLLAEETNEFFSGLAVSIPSGTTGTFFPNVPLPPKIRFLIGDVIHNARVALDYLVYELAFLEKKAPQKGTGFPIAKNEDDWASNRTQDKLRHLNPDHVNEIKSFQPFSGASWLTLLAELSNEDKHRCLVVVDCESNVQVTLNYSQTFTTVDFNSGVLPVGMKMTKEVKFENGKSVKDTLELFIHEVRQILDNFNGKFLADAVL